MPAPARAVPACSGRRNFAPSSRLFVSYRLPTRVCRCPCPRRPCRSPAGAPRSWPFSRALLCPPAFPGGRALPGAVPPPRPLASALRPLRGLRPARSLGRRPGAFPPPGPPLRGPGSAGLNWSVSLAVGLRGPAAGRGRPLRSRTRPRSGPGAALARGPVSSRCVWAARAPAGLRQPPSGAIFSPGRKCAPTGGYIVPPVTVWPPPAPAILAPVLIRQGALPASRRRSCAALASLRAPAPYPRRRCPP